jgi:WD40 repeat protein
MLSSSQDGYILKWNMDDQFNLLKHKRINDLTTNIAISISFLPNCGNKYFLCSGDHAIKIYDFENEQVILFFFNFFFGFLDFFFYFILFFL